MLCLQIIIALLLSSCAVGERVVNRVIDGETALTKETAREEVDLKLYPIVEGQKVLSHRMNLLAKESAHLAHNFEIFNNVFREYTMESNRFYISLDKQMVALKRRILALEKIKKVDTHGKKTKAN